MAVPNWNAFQLNASQDSILIRMSDAPLMQFLAWDRTGRDFEA
jgi:gentisate 1,2-dioxygenase